MAANYSDSNIDRVDRVRSNVVGVVLYYHDCGCEHVWAAVADTNFALATVHSIEADAIRYGVLEISMQRFSQ